MDKTWSLHKLSEELMKIFPNFRKLLGLHLRELGEEETTMMQMGVLRHLQEQPITASELAKRRRVSLQSASVLVQGMVEKGLIVRESDPNDRRQFLLQVTPEGLAKAEAVKIQIIQYMEGFLDGLSPEEIAAAQIFLPALNRILEHQMAANDTQTHDERQGTPEEEKTPL